MTDNSIDVSVAAVLRLIRERDEARAAVARVQALHAVSHVCSNEAWLRFNDVRAALRGES